jgi:hypothetical protein
MDPLRYNYTQLYGRPYICRDTVGFETILIFSTSCHPFVSQQRSISLSKQSFKREETVGAGPLNRSIGLEEDRWKDKGVW